MILKTTERGWAGHFIRADGCRFRRNTLIQCDDKRIVVSTVGNLISNDKIESVGSNRWYETMAFEAYYNEFDGCGYWEADVSKEVPFDSPGGLYADTWKELCHTHPDVDNVANDMHEKVVAEICDRLERECVDKVLDSWLGTEKQTDG